MHCEDSGLLRTWSPESGDQVVVTYPQAPDLKRLRSIQSNPCVVVRILWLVGLLSTLKYPVLFCKLCFLPLVVCQSSGARNFKTVEHE
jgi:hypothetical protein